MSPQIKCGSNYINSRLGALAANAAGADLPLFLSEHGYVSESSGACVFRVIGDRIETPPIHSSILPSITREFVLNTLGPDMSEYQFREAELTRWDLYSADEVFLVGTNAEVLSIQAIDQYTIGRVKKSSYPVTCRLAHQFFSRIFDSK
jgi:branched-chain amino acid aminotransferase